VALAVAVAFATTTHQPTTNPKNKSEKRGAFFAPEKVCAKAPRSPRNPPRFHHKNTTPKHAFF
jgi:hypothetical protein